MPLAPEKLLVWRKEHVSRKYSERDTILYALGVGIGLDESDEHRLRFIYEKELEALPAMASVLANPWGWLYEANAGVTRLKHVLAGHAITFHKPLPVSGEVYSDSRVKHIVDKGADKGALVYTERQLYDETTGDLLSSVETTMFCRADGGFGGSSTPVKPLVQIPAGAPDLTHDSPTSPQAALIYRLWGDGNPLHVDPEVGRVAGFKGPILHGLCTFGIAAYALLRRCFGCDQSRLHSIEARFSAPVYPGETLRTQMWRDDEGYVFQALAVERNAVVLSNGRARAAA